MKTIMMVSLIVVSLFLACNVYCDEPAKITLQFIEFFPVNNLQNEVPFEIIFKLKNTGGTPINPYAEVTLSGQVVDKKGEAVFRVVDKKYRVYNFWPGDQSGRLRFYVGSLTPGAYTIKLNINTFDRGKGVNISNEPFTMPITVN